MPVHHLHIEPALLRAFARGQVEDTERLAIQEHLDFPAVPHRLDRGAGCGRGLAGGVGMLDLAYYSSLPDPWEAAEGAIQVMTELPLRRAAKELYLAEGPARFEEEDPSELPDRLTDLVRVGCEPPARAALCDWLREVFGNPFQAVAVSPAWLSETVVSIARKVYDGQAFELLPILADALEEAGCDALTLMSHCRSAGPHAQGCWALDRVLGRSTEPAAVADRPRD